ncbi:MAG: hypothetical protein J7500_05855 [Sphingomonas sp.]|uniref:hypothetical protein n=1 Tax=Sphingomonas sp. TaxID=28214 RepID=UPI001B0C9D83|nr:hypothetical protein [Sphingomonas sp.]MBO9622219.1 hypothetical protein [Sphingomonas sp.]
MSKPEPRQAFAPAADACGPDLSTFRPDPGAQANALAVAPDDPGDLDDLDDAPHPPEPYDPAEYRWVPVRRIPRLDGWTEEKQRRFIETLADTGLVNAAARAVGMSRESAYRLRRSAHGAAFARAWDAARHHAGALIEDIAFERAIEGVEQEIYNDRGEVVAARLVHDNRLLKYLLGHLKPERYGTARQGAPDARAEPIAAPPALEESLRAMEPALPAPPEQLLAPHELAAELDLADVADGVLPRFLSEQRPPRSGAQVAADEAAARNARGAAALAREQAGHRLTDEEFADQCYHLDPEANWRRRRRSR